MRMQVSPVSNRRYKHRSRSVLSLHVCSFSLKTFFTSSQRAGCVWSWRSAELFILFFFFFSACLTSGCDVTELSASCFSSHTSLMHRGDIQRRQTQRDFISLLLHSDLSELCWVAALLLVCVRNSFSDWAERQRVHQALIYSLIASLFSWWLMVNLLLISHRTRQTWRPGGRLHV